MTRKSGGKPPRDVPGPAPAEEPLLCVELPARQRKRPRQARSVALVEALMLTGRQILEREGRAALSVHRLAEHAGVAISSIYEYFPTIESLVAAIFEDYRREARREVIASLEALPASATLLEGIEMILQTGLANLHRWLQLDSDLSVKAAYHAELMRLEMVRSEGFWTSEAIPALVRRFSSQVLVRDREKAGFLAYHAVTALPRALVIERPNYLVEADTLQLLARMLHALLTAEDSEAKSS